ncbi:hypothetical protein GIB67_036606 [Kingdonia uniflora]|uniref:Uncharacterized protein n=1 Tax=Kingdonia uniflora TaxID=39325 RepID=A0A7J7M0I6_9MAGN|nr:hypothetical protein GIB67_036606 [Kingdonia uniflora]
MRLCQIESIDSISDPRRASIFEKLCCRSQSQVELSVSIRDRTETSCILNSCIIHLCQIELIDSISGPRRACIFK